MRWCRPKTRSRTSTTFLLISSRRPLRWACSATLSQSSTGARRHGVRGRPARIRVRLHRARLPLDVRHQQRHRRTNTGQFRHGSAARRVSPGACKWRECGVFRAHRGGGWIGPQRPEDFGSASRRGLCHQRPEALHHQCGPLGPAHGVRPSCTARRLGRRNLGVRRRHSHARRDGGAEGQENGATRLHDVGGVL